MLKLNFKPFHGENQPASTRSKPENDPNRYRKQHRKSNSSGNTEIFTCIVGCIPCTFTRSPSAKFNLKPEGRTHRINAP